LTEGSWFFFKCKVLKNLSKINVVFRAKVLLKYYCVFNFKIFLVLKSIKFFFCFWYFALKVGFFLFHLLAIILFNINSIHGMNNKWEILNLKIWVKRWSSSHLFPRKNFCVKFTQIMRTKPLPTNSIFNNHWIFF
jgi:hypothetical protein